MGIFQNIDKDQKKNILYTAGAMLFIIIVLTVFIFLITQRNSKQIKTGGDSRSPAKVTFVNGSSLYGALSSDIRYANLAKDLASVAKNYYKSKNLNPIFTIENSNAPLHFTGSFNILKKKLDITIVNLPYDRMKITAIDIGDRKDISDKFGSNSKRNQFIATLPYRQDGYEIDYVSANDSFVINIYNGTDSELGIATAGLAAKLGVKDLSSESYTFIRTGDLTGDQPLNDNSSIKD